MSKTTEVWCSCVIRGTLLDEAPPADALVGRPDSALMWYRLVRSGASAKCPPEIAAALRQATATRAVEAQIMNRELTRVLDAAGDARIDLVVMKGAAIAHTHYPQPHLRPRADSDLVIRADDRGRLAAVLEACGYAATSAVDGSLVTQQRQWTRTLGRDLVHALDVHWGVFNPRAFADVLTTEELLERSVRVPALAGSARGPHPVHALLIACVHRVAHHKGENDLLWLYDIRLLAESLSVVEAADFVRLAVQRKVAAVCADSLLAAERSVGARLPPSLQSWIDGASWREAREPTAAFLVHERQVDRLVSDLRVLGNVRARVHLVVQHLFPRPEYMLRQHGVRSRVQLPYLYLRRMIEGIPRWFRR